LLLSTVVFVHVPPQSVWLLGHAQPPPWHVFPPLQPNCVPHPPQFGALGCAFVVSLTQVLPHRVVPPVQLSVHA
jgi:hypothetical protein